jgi:hypothetical protein
MSSSKYWFADAEVGHVHSDVAQRHPVSRYDVVGFRAQILERSGAAHLVMMEPIGRFTYNAWVGNSNVSPPTRSCVPSRITTGI